jgi:hypothetical protein
MNLPMTPHNFWTWNHACELCKDKKIGHGYVHDGYIKYYCPEHLKIIKNRVKNKERKQKLLKINENL